MNRLGVFLFLCVLSSCITIKKNKSPDLMQYMQGSFDSKAQSERDSTYYNISLHMYPIWEQTQNVRWLYVEQALATKQDKPYRVRIYKLTRLDDQNYTSDIYSIKDQARFIGKWKTPSFFNNFGQDILEVRKGCTVYLSRTSTNSFEGSTKPKACQSSFRGASYASTKVKVTPDQLSSWDQGWDSNDEQIWGATEGPYIFNRLISK